MNELSLITIGYWFSLLLILGFGIFVFAQKPKGAANQMFLLFCFTLSGFQLFFIIAAHLSPSTLAYKLWYANLIDVFMATTYFNFIILAIGSYQRYRWLVIGNWVVGSAIFIAALIYPHLFLPYVTPKLYFLSYLVNGPLYNAMFWWFTASFGMTFTVLFIEWARRSEEARRRVEYYIISPCFGCLTGYTAFPLVFNIHIDPLLSSLLFVFTIPMVYGMVKKDVLDIRIVVRRTVLFTLAIAAISGILIALSLASNLLSTVVPGSAFLVIPILAALAAVSAGSLYWSKAQEAERLKYEFVTVAAHKFRTPLTRIRWASDALLSRSDLPPDAHNLVSRIGESNLGLIQLSNLLMDAARMEKDQYLYSDTIVDLEPLVREVMRVYESSLKDKQIRLSFKVDPHMPGVHGDKERLTSAISVLVENAIAYSPQGAALEIALTASPGQARFAITDNGIGVTEEEKRHIFKKFYRTDRARSADTEGIGLGLNMAKSIIERHRGSIGVDSKGSGQGSMFWFTLPVK